MRPLSKSKAPAYPILVGWSARFIRSTLSSRVSRPATDAGNPASPQSGRITHCPAPVYTWENPTFTPTTNRGNPGMGNPIALPADVSLNFRRRPPAPRSYVFRIAAFSTNRECSRGFATPRRWPAVTRLVTTPATPAMRYRSAPRVREAYRKGFGNPLRNPFAYPSKPLASPFGGPLHQAVKTQPVPIRMRRACDPVPARQHQTLNVC